jgi:hypothetical protein
MGSRGLNYLTTSDSLSRPTAHNYGGQVSANLVGNLIRVLLDINNAVNALRFG